MRSDLLKLDKVTDNNLVCIHHSSVSTEEFEARIRFLSKLCINYDNISDETKLALVNAMSENNVDMENTSDINFVNKLSVEHEVSIGYLDVIDNSIGFYAMIANLLSLSLSDVSMKYPVGTYLNVMRKVGEGIIDQYT